MDANTIMTRTNELHDARASRLAANTGAINALGWAVLWVGAIIVIVVCFVCNIRFARAAMLVTACVSMLTATMFVLLFELQAPFRSKVGISPDAWTALVMHIDDMDKSSGSMTMSSRM